MTGAIFFSSKYGSTAQYARWIGEATGLPVFDIKDAKADPASYDFLILGSPILYFRLSIRKWVKGHLAGLGGKPICLFSVSGAPAGPKLDGWIAKSLPESFIKKMHHVALRGRQVPKELSWYDRMMLKIGAMANRDPEARKQELHGFDFVDKTSIAPILKWVQQWQASQMSS
ncbi:flavodoxin domain-containing protein [Flavobacteriaceae bacterium 3-367]|uniref:flavodoxin domain-containing protein n=1 Tax=Eudoraea algarum TaxID=3417568 RepID=UPI003295765F